MTERVKLYSKEDYRNKKAKTGQAVTDEIIRGLGGKENIISVDNCFTRLRVALHHPENIDEGLLKSTGANGVVRNQNEVQVIYGVRLDRFDPG